MSADKAKAADKVRSLRKLAIAIGAGREAVRRWRHRPDWPFGDGPWNPPDVKSWAARTIQPATNAPVEEPAAAPSEQPPDAGGGELKAAAQQLGPERFAKLRLVLERAAKTKLERQILASQYVHIDEIERARVARIHGVKNGLLLVRHRLEAAPELGFLLEEQRRQVAELVDSFHRELLEGFANG